MNNLNSVWQWFLRYGDKILAWATTTVAGAAAAGYLSQAQSGLLIFILASCVTLHNSFLPEAKAAPAVPPKP